MDVGQIVKDSPEAPKEIIKESHHQVSYVKYTFKNSEPFLLREVHFGVRISVLHLASPIRPCFTN